MTKLELVLRYGVFAVLAVVFVGLEIGPDTLRKQTDMYFAVLLLVHLKAYHSNVSMIWSDDGLSLHQFQEL